MPRLLLLAPDPAFSALCSQACEGVDLDVIEVDTVDDLRGHVDLATLIVVPPNRFSEGALEQIRQRLPTSDILVVSDRPSVEEAVATVRSGATDYLPGPASSEQVCDSIQRWIERKELVGSQESISQIMTLMELGQTVTGMLRLDGLYEEIIEQVQRAFQPDTVSLMLFNPDSERLRLVAERGLSPEAAGSEVDLEDSIAGYVVRSGQPQLLLGGLEGTSFEHLARGGSDIGSAMSVPLRVHERTLGVLNVSRHRARPPYNDSDANLLHIFAAQIAIAVQNAQLYDSLREERDRILEAQEMVRRELARDLHDGLTQMLATLAITIDFLGGQVRERRIGWEALPRELEGLRATARQAIHDARTMTFGMRPLVLETRGLVAALKQYLAALAEGDSLTEYVLDFDDASEMVELDQRVARTVFAILQEAINNARKHAHAKRISVEIRRRTERGRPTLTGIVRDDGRGFDVSQVEGDYEERYSFGLVNMKERAGLIDGRFHMSSNRSGTVVQLEVPLPPE